jgi:protease-4
VKSFFKGFISSFLGALFGVVFGIFILITGVIGLVSVLTADSEAEKATLALKKDSVIVIDLSMPITEVSKESFFGTYENYNLHDIREALQDASEDDSVQGLMIKMTSGVPMGWSTAKEFRKIITDFLESKKSVVAYGEYADEKALYIASVADKIYMHPTGEISWNGFAATPNFYKGLFDKLELKPIIFKAGKFKSAIEPFTNTKMSDESKQQTAELLEDLWEETVSVIASSRNIDVNELREFAESASIRTANQAKKVDLIDGVTRYSDLVEMFLKKEKGDETRVLTAQDLKRLISVKGYVGLKQNNIFAAFEKGSLFSGAKNPKRNIGVLVLEGSIVSGQSEQGSIGSDSVVLELQRLRLDKKIKGVILRINSPGGSALASDVIWAEVEKLKQEKPVYVSMGDVAASGGYYIAAGADKIFAEVNTITGSIGVFSILFNVSQTFENKAGITFDRVVTNQYADLGSAVRDMKEEEKEIFQNDVTRIYRTFLGVVEKGRKFSKFSDVEMVSQGRVWSGAQAKEVGLVDKLGGLEECAASMATDLKLDGYELDFYPKSKGFGGFLDSLVQVRAEISTVSSAFKDPSSYARNLKKKLEKERVLMLSPYAISID